MTLTSLRRELKPLGFTFTTKSLSWGRHATYKHIATGEMLTFNVAGGEQWEKWQPLFQYLQENDTRIAAMEEKVVGLRKGKQDEFHI